MKILIVADGRSPIAINWMKYLINQGVEVHLVSTFPCERTLDYASLHFIEIAFSSKTENRKLEPENNLSAKSFQDIGTPFLRKILTPMMRTKIRHIFGPKHIPAAAAELRSIINEIQPDLVHAMRIPFEGMIAAEADPPMPLLVSVWGNDFTLHSKSTKTMAKWTRKTLQRTDALHTDCYRDIRIAKKWKFNDKKLSFVLPGAGGIQLDKFYPPEQGDVSQRPKIVNPRGYRAYIKNSTFFKAIPRVLRRHRDALFLCPNMADEADAHNWVEKLGIQAAVELQPRLTREEIAEQYRASQIVLSISTHDGTPNSFLEAIACGCFPIAGDIESLREWVTDGENGFLINPNDYKALANAILKALKDDELRYKARKLNREMIETRANHDVVMQEALGYYQKMIQNTKS